MGKLGRYELLLQLGAGGMAEVFLAHEAGVAGVERLVVIKRVLPALAQDDLFTIMLLNEARISTRLNHPNIAHVYEVGKEGAQPFIAMEFVHGVNLRTILHRSKDARISPELVALIGARVASALHHAHTLTDLKGEPLHIVHRDVSPDNIHVSFEGVVKVLDFGIAKARTNIESTTSGVLKGKYSYMSPEQAGGQDLDARSDLFSLGIILFEALTYKRLFRKQGVMQMLKAIAEQELFPPSAYRDEPLPAGLDEIVMRALQRDLQARYGSARELQEDLQRFLREHPATETDLEAYLAALFGPAEQNREKLRAALETGTIVPLKLPGTPSHSLPGAGREEETSEPSGLDDVQDEPRTTTAPRGYARKIRAQHPGRSWRWLVVIAVLIVAAAVAVLLSWHAIRPGGPRRTAAAMPSKLVAPRPDAAVPRAPELRPATLVLKTTPPGASVTMDGQRHEGKTPTVLENLRAGQAIALTIELVGHQPEEVRLTLEPGEVHTMERALVPVAVREEKRRRSTRMARHPRVEPKGFGLLTLDTRPWAVVFVDGKKVGVTPLFRLRLPAGRHQLKLRNPDLNRVKTLSISIPKDGELRRKIKL